VRIISENKLVKFWTADARQANAKPSLIQWRDVVRGAAWRNPAEVRQTFGKNVDFVQSDNGNPLAVFNIHGNHYRLIAAIHYLRLHSQKGRVYVLRLLSHQEYDENNWKREL